MKKREDAEVIEAARFVAVARLNDWIGLPFDIGAALKFIQRLPIHLKRLPPKIKEEGAINWILGIIFLLGMMWLLAPLRQALLELELAMAMLFIGIWLVLLPFILIGAGLHFGSLALALFRRWSVRRAQAASRAAIRFFALASTYLIYVWYGDAIRAFVERSKDLSVLF